MESTNWKIIESTLEEMVRQYKKDLLFLGRRIVPTLTHDDLLQPNDYPELENHPEFRYVEGVLAGIESALMAVRAIHSEQST